MDYVASVHPVPPSFLFVRCCLGDIRIVSGINRAKKMRPPNRGRGYTRGSRASYR